MLLNIQLSCLYLETLKKIPTLNPLFAAALPSAMAWWRESEVGFFSGMKNAGKCLYYRWAVCQWESVALMSPTWKPEILSSPSHPSRAEFYINKVMPLRSLRFPGERHTGEELLLFLRPPVSSWLKGWGSRGGAVIAVLIMSSNSTPRVRHSEGIIHIDSLNLNTPQR